MSSELADTTPANALASFKVSLLVSLALGLVAGATVAVVLQDASVVVPFLALALLGSPAVHGLRRMSQQVLWKVVAGGAALGATGLVIGLFGTDDGAAQAAGVLGGVAALAAATVAAATLGATSMAAARGQRRETDSSSGP